MAVALIVLASLTFFYLFVSVLIANDMAISNRVPVTKTPADHRVPHIKCPILFINGNCDKAVPPDDAIALHKASGNSLDDLWIAESAGHSLVYRTNPEEYVDRVTAFFSKV